MRRFWRHEDAVVALVLVAIAIPALVALPLLWFGPYELKTKLTLSLAIVVGSGALVLAIRTRVMRPLQTLANLTASLRELWGNPNPYATGSFPSENPVLVTLGWVALFLVIFGPLAVRRYRSLNR